MHDDDGQPCEFCGHVLLDGDCQNPNGCPEDQIVAARENWDVGNLAYRHELEQRDAAADKAKAERERPLDGCENDGGFPGYLDPAAA